MAISTVSRRLPLKATELPMLETVVPSPFMQDRVHPFSFNLIALAHGAHYSKMMAGSGSFPRVVRVTAAVRISAPPAHAYGPRCSPSNWTPSQEPRAGSMLRKTPAREAGTWWIPQFQSSVVVAVQSRPLMASAAQAVGLTWANGSGWTFRWVMGLSSQGPRTTTASMTVPERMVWAVTTGGLWVSISFLLSRIQAKADRKSVV